MKAKDGVIKRLNNILTIELTAINQYFLHAEMAENSGFHRVAKLFRSNSMSEMQDAKLLIKHILYLEGRPDMQNLNLIEIGDTILEDLQLNLKAEENAVNVLNEAITHCASVEDYTTRNILENMVREEEEHVDVLETQLEIISTIGLDLYLSQQMHIDD